MAQKLAFACVPERWHWNQPARPQGSASLLLASLGISRRLIPLRRLNHGKELPLLPGKVRGSLRP